MRHFKRKKREGDCERTQAKKPSIIFSKRLPTGSIEKGLIQRWRHGWAAAADRRGDAKEILYFRDWFAEDAITKGSGSRVGKTTENGEGPQASEEAGGLIEKE